MINDANQKLDKFDSRSIKCSFKDLMILPAWELLSRYWKDEILVKFHPIWKANPRELCGVIMDPAKFIPQYMLRFLERRELEGDLPAPGNYIVEYVVSSHCESIREASVPKSNSILEKCVLNKRNKNTLYRESNIRIP